jgi:myo-inositol-1(or 4)-monophosphatase
MQALERRFALAQDLTARAAAMALSMRPPPGAGQGILKGAQDWLTEADGVVERFLSAALAEAFPEDGFQGEEDGATRAGTLRWVVDPIDGTSNFARGGSRWCVSVGLLDGRTPLLGVLVAPGLGETYAACAGRGATLNGAAIHAAETADLGRAIVEIGWSPRLPASEYLALCGRVIAAGAAPRTMGSGAMGLAETAAGRIDAYVELHINLWDVAGALAILAEAGAVVNGFMDGDAPVIGGPILAAAPGVAVALSRAAGFPG